MKLRNILTILAILIFSSCRSQENDIITDGPLTYTNPIINKYLADPFITYSDGYYYFFATGGAQDGRYIPIYRSENLRKWEFVRGAVVQGSTDDWNYKNFWAPEVYMIDGKFYLYYTASPQAPDNDNSGNRVGVAVSDKIEGPYVSLGPVVRHASIDGHVFQDKDGCRYIYYTIEHHSENDGLVAGQIYMEKMASLTELSGSPVKIFSGHSWQEGPFMQLRDGKYYLSFSCGNWQNETYNVRYAIGDSPNGPFVEQQDTILASNGLFKGPGHHAMFMDKTGHDWIVYHAWDNSYTARYPMINKIFFENGKIKCDGPTSFGTLYK